MSGRLSMFVLGVTAAVAISYLANGQTVAGQTASPTRFAAVPGEKGGQDISARTKSTPTGPRICRRSKGTRDGRSAPGRASSPRARTASSSFSVASCRISGDPRR